MSYLENRVGGWTADYRWPIIVATLVFVALSGSGVAKLQLNNDYRIFFAADNPELLANDELEATYIKTDNLMIVIAAAGPTIFTPDNLDILETLTNAAWQIPYTTPVDSLTNFQHTRAEGDDLLVSDLVRGGATLDTAQVADIKAIAAAEPLINGQIVSTDGLVAIVNVVVSTPEIDQTVEIQAVVDSARAILDDARGRYPDARFYLTGEILMEHSFLEASIADMQRLIPFSVVLMFVILALLLRSVTAVMVTLTVVVFAVLTAMGMAGHMGLPLTPVIATAPIIILTVAVANCVHLMVTYRHGLEHDLDTTQAMEESLRVNLQPVFLASISTAIGFLSMNFADVPPFMHLGNTVAIGMLASFMFAVVFLPAVIGLVPQHVSAHSAARGDAMQALGEFVVRNRRRLLPCMGALICILVAFIPANQLDDDYVKYFDDSFEFRRATDFMLKHIPGIYAIDFSLSADEPGGISEPAFLREVEQFAQWVSSQPEVAHVNSLIDTLKRLNKNLHGDDDDWYRLPDQRDMAAQYLLLYEMSLPYGLDLNNQINIDKSALRFRIVANALSSNALIALNDRASNWLRDNASHIDATRGSGAMVMFAYLGRRNIAGMLTGTTVALVLISVLLIAAFRSVKIGLASLVPNLAPAAMGFGLWGIFVGEVGIALSVVTGMTLGIVVDDTVHFLSKYLRARREQHVASPQAVIYAFRTVGRALLVTSTMLAAGFLVLSLSGYKVNGAMGLLTAIIISLALIADFMFLPPLLMKIEEDKE